MPFIKIKIGILKNKCHTSFLIIHCLEKKRKLMVHRQVPSVLYQIFFSSTLINSYIRVYPISSSYLSCLVDAAANKVTRFSMLITKDMKLRLMLICSYWSLLCI